MTAVVLSHADAAKRYLRNEPISDEEGTFWRRASDEAGRRYFALQHAVGKKVMLAEIPPLFIKSIKAYDWKRWIWAGKEYEAPSLGEYITRKPPYGLGATLEMVEDWVRDDIDAYGIFTKETTVPVGSNQYVGLNNVKTLPAPVGNKRAYLLQRLARDHSDILEEYRKGKYPSARAAAIAAGIIKKPTPFEQILKLLPKVTDEDERKRIREWQYE